MGTDATNQPLIPGTEPPAKRRKFALSWAADESYFAKWLIAEWNSVFKGLPGGKSASMVRGNTGAAVRFYRRQCALPEAERFSREAIIAGIRAYADNPANKALKPPAWRYFKDWIDEAEDRIAAELSRVGYQPPPPPNPKRDAVAPLLAHLALGALADECTAAGNELFEHIESYRRPKRAGPFDEVNQRYYEKLKDLVKRIQAMTIAEKQVIARRASDAFEDFYGVRYDHKMLVRRNRRRAIALALLDLDSQASGPKPQVSPKEPSC